MKAKLFYNLNKMHSTDSSTEQFPTLNRFRHITNLLRILNHNHNSGYWWGCELKTILYSKLYFIQKRTFCSVIHFAMHNFDHLKHDSPFKAHLMKEHILKHSFWVEMFRTFVVMGGKCFPANIFCIPKKKKMSWHSNYSKLCGWQKLANSCSSDQKMSKTLFDL